MTRLANVPWIGTEEDWWDCGHADIRNWIDDSVWLSRDGIYHDSFRLETTNQQ